MVEPREQDGCSPMRNGSNMAGIKQVHCSATRFTISNKN